MKLRIGGWTRLWIVLCVIFGAVALAGLQNDLRSASTSAAEAYQKEVSWTDTCAKLDAKKLADAKHRGRNPRRAAARVMQGRAKRCARA